MIVIKRDGREIPYNSDKIRDAVHQAMVSTNKETDPSAANDNGHMASDDIEFYVDQKIKELNKDKISVEEIQDLVEKTLIEYNLPEIAKHYILYRNQRSKVRSIHSEMNKAIAQLVDPVADSDDKRENANINSDTTMGTMLKVGTTVLKDFNLKNIYRPEYSKLHNAGYMHMHDLDFSSLTINSISSDSWVVLKDSSGQVSLLKGRELDRFFNEVRSEMVGFNGWQTLSQENKFVNLELARRKHKKCEIYVVRSPSAMIRVTGKHVVPVKRGGMIVEIHAKDIRVGDELIAGKLPQLDSSIDELNLLDFLPQNVRHSIEDGHRLKLRESKLVSKFPSITLKLTRELGRLSGIFYTYGGVNEDSRVLISSIMKDNLMDEFKEIIYKLSSSVKLVPMHELHDSFFEIDDEYVSYLLRDVLCYKRYVYDYRIPGWYFNTNDEFLKGFIEVINETALPFVDLFSKNREFVEDFRLLLKKFDIDAVVHFLPRIKNSKGEYEEDHCWHLTYKPCNCFGQEAEKTKPDYVVQSITREDYDDYVYDLQTEDHHFWSNGVVIHNCLYIPLSKLLHRGYSTGHGFLRAPATIRSASALTCIAIQSSQNDFFGGQAIPSLDYALAPYVAKSYVRNCVEFLKDLDLIPDTVDIKKNFIHYFDDEITKDIEKPVEQNYSIMDHLDEIDSKLNELIDVNQDQLAHMHKVAKRRTTGETEQALEAAVHNLCSMHSRAGSQTPFSSVNVGLSTTWEGRTVTYSLLKAVEEGLGLGETAIFPISIFKMKKGITDKGSPNYDLFQYACKVSAKRLYPNFLSIDAPFNLVHYRKDRPEYQASSMGCVHGTESALWKLDDEIYVSDFGRMSRILMNKYPLIQYSENSNYVDLEKVDIGIWDSFNNKFAKVKKFIINQNVTDWVIVKLDDESTLTITPDHPLPVEGRGRIRADELKRGDRIKHSINEKLYTGSDEFATVLSIEKASIGSISETTSYDVETDTDRFDLDSIQSHNCRTRVIENKVDPQHAITEGRGNLFWTTINFPLIALDAKKEAGVTDPLPIFMTKLYEIVNNVIQYSLDRFKVVAKRKAKNYPFMMGQHEYVGSEKLLPNDDIESVIKEGTMAVGFIGLSETLVALIGKHHGESEEAQELGLTILNLMKKWVDEASEKYGYNFGVMASPAEGCTGRLLRITRKKYGVIEGVTDKEYFTNSFHICPTYKISAWKKVHLEAPYHAICTSGAISYVELDTDTVRNPQAFEDLVNFMAGSGCGYFAINHPMTRDPVCGYVGPLRPDGSCPRCGRKEFEGVAVSKLLSLTSYSPDPEYDVRLHENEDTPSNTL